MSAQQPFGGSGLPASLLDRLGYSVEGWPAVVVIHDRPVIEGLVETLEAVIDRLISLGDVGFACDLGDVRDLFVDGLALDTKISNL